jgi:hypothetical protein
MGQKLKKERGESRSLGSTHDFMPEASTEEEPILLKIPSRVMGTQGVVLLVTCSL